MHQPRRFRSGLALIILLIPVAGITAFGNRPLNDYLDSIPHQITSADTTRPRQKLLQTNPTSRQASKPLILPGTRLDPRFRNIPAQDPAVAKAAPAWLRAKANGTPMYMIDGHGATAVQIRRLLQKQVVSVNVLEGAKAAKLYGPNARNGMVIITTKAGVEPKS